MKNGRGKGYPVFIKKIIWSGCLEFLIGILVLFIILGIGFCGYFLHIELEPFLNIPSL